MPQENEQKTESGTRICNVSCAHVLPWTSSMVGGGHADPSDKRFDGVDGGFTLAVRVGARKVNSDSGTNGAWPPSR